MPKPKDWLRFAQYDLEMACRALDPSYPIVPAALYHSQQCAEKALKAFLVLKKITPPRTHDIVGLLDLCVKQDPEFLKIMDATVDLTSLVTDGRYPSDAFSMPDTTTAHIMIEKAERILVFGEGYL